jgi:hypothetical protein
LSFLKILVIAKATALRPPNPHPGGTRGRGRKKDLIPAFPDLQAFSLLPFSSERRRELSHAAAVLVYL